MDEKARTILELLQELAPDRDFRNSSDYVADGLLDSLDIVLLIEGLEKRFSVLIPGDAITADRFRSAASIAELIK